MLPTEEPLWNLVEDEFIENLETMLPFLFSLKLTSNLFDFSFVPQLLCLSQKQSTHIDVWH
uniref:Uncharacterized protein n=1 Tax=Rhizophora mucronata TaxID=61149 RepID=A0A2P2JCJ7_RHIMU